MRRYEINSLFVFCYNITLRLVFCINSYRKRIDAGRVLVYPVCLRATYSQDANSESHTQ